MQAVSLPSNCSGRELIKTLVEDCGDSVPSLLLLACIIVFSRALDPRTYKTRDGRNEQVLKDEKAVRAEPELPEEEASIFTACRRSVYRFVQWLAVAHDRPLMFPVTRKRATESASENSGSGAERAAEEVWVELRRCEWVPMQYRYFVQYLLHFACAVMAERFFIEEREVHLQIRREDLEYWLIKDMERCFGPEASNTLELMLGHVGHRHQFDYTLKAFRLDEWYDLITCPTIRNGKPPAWPSSEGSELETTWEDIARARALMARKKKKSRRSGKMGRRTNKKGKAKMENEDDIELSDGWYENVRTKLVAKDARRRNTPCIVREGDAVDLHEDTFLTWQYNFDDEEAKELGELLASEDDVAEHCEEVDDTHCEEVDDTFAKQLIMEREEWDERMRVERENDEENAASSPLSSA